MSIDDIKNSLIDKIESDGSLDYIQLFEKTSLIGQVTSTILGFLITIIFILIPLIITVEIIYICFPIIRGKTDKLIMRFSDSAVLNKTVGFTLRDARSAVEQANTVMIGKKSALAIYLSIKCKSIMFIMFLVSLVLSGTGPIAEFVWKAIDGFISILS